MARVSPGSRRTRLVIGTESGQVGSGLVSNHELDRGKKDSDCEFCRSLNGYGESVLRGVGRHVSVSEQKAN